MSETKKETKKEVKKESDKDNAKPLDDTDISLLKRYGRGPYFEPIKKLEDELKEFSTKIGKLSGIKESDTGLSAPSEWFLTVFFVWLIHGGSRKIRRCYKENKHCRWRDAQKLLERARRSRSTS